MHAGDAKLKDFFQSELSALRNEAMTFAGSHPQLAASLGLNARQAADPQVELLLQSFAFLTGRLQHQVELDQAALPNSLLGLLYPHLAAPVPAMLVAQLMVKPDGINFAKEQLLARESYLSASAVDQQGRRIDCRFRTCFATPLTPLQVEDVALEAAARHPDLLNRPGALSVLRVRIAPDTGASFEPGPSQRLRFYLDANEQHAYTLYEALAGHLRGILLRHAGQAPVWLPLDALRWLGDGADEAALPANPHTHPGYRLLQEYFSFPQKFMFFDVNGLDLRGSRGECELLFVLDLPDPGLALDPGVLRLNCVPLINLFSQRLDPIALDHKDYEYHLFGDIANHRYCEIYAIEALESTRPDGSTRLIAPYFAMDDFRRQDQQDYFYLPRRARSEAAGVAGSELYVSFLDQRFELTQLADEVIGGRALCTNRRLPEQLLAGSALRLEGAGLPIAACRVLSRPTPHQTPADIGSRPWTLVSQLALNHLSLADGPAALSALKDILRLHVGSQRQAGLAQIDALKRLSCRAIVRHCGADGWRGFMRGSEVTLEFDRAGFDHGSAVLFCSVLRHFFRLYATVNNIVELSMVTTDQQEETKQWQALAGARSIL